MKPLMCAVIGDGSTFVVDIDDRKKVAYLKDMIKEKNQETIKCDAKDLTLYVAKKNGSWLTTDDPDVLQLKEGVVTAAISDMMKNQMDPSYRVRNTAFGFPDEDAAEDGEIHVLVKVPEATVGTTALWLVRGSVANALSAKGVRCRLYRLAGTYLGYYDPARRTGDRNVALWYEDKTLCIHILFETKENALRFENALREERLTIGSLLNAQVLVVDTRVDQVPVLSNLLQRIFYEHYEPQETESPQDTMSSFSASTSIIDTMTDEFKYQRIESEVWFGPVGKAHSCHLMPHEHCKNHDSYNKYDRDKSNRLALSPDMHSWYDGLTCAVPVLNICVESVSQHPVINNRHEVKLVVRALNAAYGRLISTRLKEDAIVSSDLVEMRTSVHVENPKVFRTCMEWKYKQIQKLWQDYYSMTSAAV